MEDFVVNVLSNVGVPAAIAFYVLVKVNHNLTELTKAVAKLTYTLEKSHFNQWLFFLAVFSILEITSFFTRATRACESFNFVVLPFLSFCSSMQGTGAARPRDTRATRACQSPFLFRFVLFVRVSFSFRFVNVGGVFRFCVFVWRLFLGLFLLLKRASHGDEQIQC